MKCFQKIKFVSKNLLIIKIKYTFNYDLFI